MLDDYDAEVLKRLKAARTQGDSLGVATDPGEQGDAELSRALYRLEAQGLVFIAFRCPGVLWWQAN